MQADMLLSFLQASRCHHQSLLLRSDRITGGSRRHAALSLTSNSQRSAFSQTANSTAVLPLWRHHPGLDDDTIAPFELGLEGGASAERRRRLPRSTHSMSPSQAFCC